MQNQSNTTERKARSLMTLTLLSGERTLIDMSHLDRIMTDGAVTRLFFQKDQQLTQVVVRESINEIKYLARLFDELANTHGVAQ